MAKRGCGNDRTVSNSKQLQKNSGSSRPGWKNFLEPWGWKVKRLLYQKDLK